jgi:hypothetical protein
MEVKSNVLLVAARVAIIAPIVSRVRKVLRQAKFVCEGPI